MKKLVIAVFGTPFKGRLPKKLRESNTYCGSESQGIILSTSELYVSKRVAKGGLRCVDREVDSHELELFAEDY